MRSTSKAPPARPISTNFTRLRMPLGIVAALMAVLALALPSFASADPAGEVTVYKEGLRSSAFVKNVTAGPDGNVWFVDRASPRAIGLITPGGAITEYVSGTNLSGLNAGSKPNSIVAGPGGSKYLWFTDESGTTPAIGSIDSTSPETATEFCATCAKAVSGLNAGAKPRDIAVGPEGNLWFADASGTTPAIGVAILNAGKTEIEKFEEFKIGPAESGGFGGSPANGLPDGIVAGPDGNLWFTTSESLTSANAVGKIDPGTHAIEEFPTGEESLPGGEFSTVGPYGIVAGPDGNVWFAEPGTNKANGQGLCRILTSGEVGKFTCFSGGLIPSSNPTDLTVAPGGKLWFTDTSGLEEVQGLEIKATENLGGTYKLGFKGEETGWAGSGDTTQGGVGTGDVTRFPTSGTVLCSFTVSSKNATCPEAFVASAKVGMRITCASCSTTVPVKTTIAAASGTTIEMSNPAISSQANKSTSMGWVENVSTTAGAFAVGQKLTSSSGSPSNSEIIAVTGSTITTEAVPTAAGIKTGATLEAGSKEVKNVTTTSGCPVEGEEISGEGIQAGTTIAVAPSSCEPTSLTLSKVPVKTGTGISLSANLPYSASGATIQAALGKLPATKESIGVGGEGVVSPIKREIAFGGLLKNADVEQIACNGAGLTGTSPSCTVTTTTPGVPNAVGCMTTSGEACGRYPRAELYAGVGGITSMPGGNVWLSTGTQGPSQEIAKFGTEPPLNVKVTKTGTGSGTVTSEPSGINCGSGSECEEEFASGTEVTLTATPDEGSKLTGWTGCTSESEGKCIVNVSGFNEIEVEANFGPSSNRRTLTITKSANGPGGLGSISSKPKGIKCGANCNKAVASMYKETPVLLTEKPGKNSKFVKWNNVKSGGPCDEATTATCTLPIAEDESLEAVFALLGETGEKVLSPAEPLTVSKGESTGAGTVKGTSGLGCEAECTQTTVLYQGPITGFKPKPGKLVTLKQAPAFGSVFSGWSGCDTEPVVEGSTQCVVEMDEAHLVTAEYTALPNKVLTLNKPYSTGNGSVASKPKGIKCATACTQAVANMPEGAKVELIAKPGKETLFVEWKGGDCNGETSPTCIVTMNTNETTEAVFNKGGKAFLEGSEPTLTLAKAGKGFGTVKGTSGLACEVLCSSTSVLYQGPVVGPPAKPGKLVILKATSAPGSKAVKWSGCDEEPVVEAEVQCVVTMEATREVTAKFSELE